MSQVTIQKTSPRIWDLFYCNVDFCKKCTRQQELILHEKGSPSYTPSWCWEHHGGCVPSWCWMYLSSGVPHYRIEESSLPRRAIIQIKNNFQNSCAQFQKRSSKADRLPRLLLENPETERKSHQLAVLSMSQSQSTKGLISALWWPVWMWQPALIATKIAAQFKEKVVEDIFRPAQTFVLLMK